MKIKSTQQLLLLLMFTIVSMSFILPNGNFRKPSGKVYKGYLIKTSGDTLHGKIQMLSPTQNQVKVKFINEEGKRITFKAKDINSYAFKAQVWNKKEKRNIQKWIYYTKKTVKRPPIPFAGNNILMQREVEGKINIYNYYIETRSNQNTEHVIYLEKENKLHPVNKSNYKKLLKKLMTDSEILHNRIGTKGYTYRFLNQTVSEYNQYLSDTEESTIGYDLK